MSINELTDRLLTNCPACDSTETAAAKQMSASLYWRRCRDCGMEYWHRAFQISDVEGD